MDTFHDMQNAKLWKQESSDHFYRPQTMVRILLERILV